MISSKPRLVVPYGLKTLLEGISRAVLKTNPQNITQFAAVYFKELIVFREEKPSLDIKDLVKQFHQCKVEKWSEGTTQEKKPEYVKESGETSTVSQEPTRMEKSTDTEEDNIAGPQFSNKTTQFPSVHAELPQEPEATSEEAVSGPSKASTPKTATPPSSPCPTAVSPEVAYVPADPAQFAAQMLGKVSSVHYDQSDVLMVDVATSMPVFSNEVLSSEAAEDNMVAASVAYSDEGVARQVVSQTSGHVDLGSKPKDNKAEPPTASLLPLQDEQEPPAHDQAPEVPLQADTEVTSAIRISSVYKDDPVIEGVTYVELMPGQIVIPLPDQAASLKENELLPPVSSTPTLKTDSGTSEKSVDSAKFAQLEDAKLNSSVYVEGEATVVISDTFLKGPSALSLDAEGSANVVGSEKSLHLEVEIVAIVPEQEKSWENFASQEMGVKPVLSGEATKTVHSGTSVRSSSGPPPPGPESLTEPEIEPEWEAAPEQGLMKPAIATSEAGQPPPYSNMWTLYCLTDMNQQSRPSPPPAPGPFPQATLYLSNPKDPQFLQHPPKVTSPTYVMMDDSKKTSAPPFILVGSSVQEAQDWKPLPGHALVPQSDTLKRYAAVQVPIAVPADQKFQKQPPNPQNASPPTSGQDVPRPQSPVFLSVAFPVEDVAKKGSGSGDKHTPFGSYGIAGEITVTTAHVRKAET
ncbi:calcium-binding tyrosine phosphorylation-regulated protein isoform X1 [Pteropus medius]|uniref:calcium-binding tyrosine phosphorylation-regulated protein isoform X1 n=2 Tax=Pteropus vampyrus TaxID=132908 RepID=UPI00196B8E29|nr:calcium-binding tyrosine phosphorylation-regulated protein isoform X1 [Pteropus giganteus]XP_039700228.1 calcium-binding tyrosine phosphorylation-regulated protein isoform X1 [Pteropus giganteus]XP_039700236.1 calcium-binding tyrosine phosphorylation-regulated protein isoform X1 [Pteropus giganteus]XP_039700243.1 calcium-binding tyrosine phosphorylation-regulated protein isoform X1 [Pteropus giganteus]XP_039700252.1 calcium-binding tyrosine phosphorylation-regulated protein isoform X1 [Ptero